MTRAPVAGPGEVVAMLAHLTFAKGYPPTVRELGEALGYSPNSLMAVHYWLRELRDTGQVTWEPGKPRTLRVTE